MKLLKQQTQKRIQDSSHGFLSFKNLIKDEARTRTSRQELEDRGPRIKDPRIGPQKANTPEVLQSRGKFTANLAKKNEGSLKLESNESAVI